MEWKVWTLVLGVGMLVLALIGLVVHSDMRLVGADLVGAFVALVVILLLNRRAAAVGIPIASAIALFVMAGLAATSHGSPVLVALTLAFAFAFAFLSWTKLDQLRAGGAGSRRPRAV